VEAPFPLTSSYRDQIIGFIQEPRAAGHDDAATEFNLKSNNDAATMEFAKEIKTVLVAGLTQACLVHGQSHFKLKSLGLGSCHGLTVRQSLY
jgi:type IV pilus biogenesis protein CpaD/CtpE